MIVDKQLIYLISIYFVATVCTFALDWQLPGFQQVAEFSKRIDLDRYVIQDYMTYWQLTHFLTRVCLGYFCPKYWQAIFIIDFGWESLEWFKWGAHNWYDLIWNMLGLITGIMLRHHKIFEKYFNKEGKKSTDSVTTTSNDEATSGSAAAAATDHAAATNANADADAAAVAANADTSPHVSIKSGDEHLNSPQFDKKLSAHRSPKRHSNSYDSAERPTHDIYFSKKNTGGIEIVDGAQLELSRKHKKDKIKKHKTKRN